MVNIRAVASVAALIGFGGLVTGCGSSDDGGSSSSSSSDKSKPLQVLYVGDTTGPTKAPGDEQLAGLKAGIKYWNAHGGFNGRQAKLSIVNTNGDPATAVSSTVKYLSSHDAPDLTWAGNEGNQIAAMIPFVSKRGLLSMSVNDGHLQCVKNASSACTTYFSLGGAPSVGTKTAAEWFKSKGYKTVGILEEQIAFTQSETPAIEAALKAEGIKSVKASFPDDAVDLTSQLSKLKSSGAQAVFAEALGAPAGYALSGRTKLGWDAPVLFDIAGSSLDLSKLAKPGDLKDANVIVGSPTNGKNDIAGVKAMIESAGPQGLGKQPLYVAAFGWDALVSYRNAIAQAKTTEPKAVTKALENLNATAKADPILANTKNVGWSAENHENLGLAPTDYQVIPAGPIVGGQIGGDQK